VTAHPAPAKSCSYSRSRLHLHASGGAGLLDLPSRPMNSLAPERNDRLALLLQGVLILADHPARAGRARVPSESGGERYDWPADSRRR
jgi:hypothetical protein